MARSHGNGGNENPPNDPASEDPVTQEAEAQLPPGEVDHANYLGKITVGQCGGNPSLAKSANARVPVMMITGIATGSKVVHFAITDEDFIALVGMFHAKNLQTGAEYRSGVCYLPGGYHENIVEEIEQQIKRIELDGEDPNRRSKFEPVQVQFSMQFDAQPARNPSGYSYVARSLLPVSKADPLSVLLKQAMPLLALPAPTEGSASAA